MSDHIYGLPGVEPTPEQRRSAAVRGLALGREVLAAKGVPPPADDKHRDAYDPPLTTPEVRHWVHVRYTDPVAGCRFCDTVTPTSHDASTNEGGTA